MTIREYQQSDWNEVCRIFDASKPLELASAGLNASFVALAVDEARIAAFARSMVLVWADEAALRGFVGCEGAFINWLFVDPLAFRRGIGRTLLRSVLSRINGEARLWVAEGNTAALALYTSEGFRPIEHREVTNNGLPCKAIKLALRR